MPVDQQFVERLVEIACCPGCGSQLRNTASGLVCSGCAAEFPALGGLPTVLAASHDLVARWRAELGAFEAMMQQTRAGIEADLGRFDLLASMRSRLQKTLQANVANTAQVLALFQRAGLSPDPDPDARQLDGPRAAAAPLVEHFEHLIRDWGWDADGSVENRTACERLISGLGASRELGRTLVLGAGACRLAHDVHRALAPPLLVALDIDPLVLLVAREVLFGDGVELAELPIDPATDAVATITRKLARPGDPPANFVLLLADAFDPPFAEATFDTVITPWFVDVASDDLREVLALVHHLLRPGGRWLNQGPLLYRTTSFARRHTKEEVLELLALSGFDLLHQAREQTTYLQSPASGHARLEDVFSFVARKGVASSAAPTGTDTPVWIILPHLPVPLLPALTGLRSPHPAFQLVQSLIDGKRSLSDIAHIMESRMQLPPHVAPVDVAGALLLKIHHDISS